MTTAASLIADPTAGSPPRRRRWVPVSLKLFLAMLLLLGVGSVVWVGVPAYRQHVAIQEIERFGGMISFNPIGPDWLRESLGEGPMHCIDEIESVRFRPDEETYHSGSYRGLSGPDPYTTGPVIDDSTIGCITKIPHVKSLDLRWTKVTDAGMKHVSQLHDLRVLILDGTAVSDASAKFIAKLINLEQLHAENCRLTEAGLMQLRLLTKLELISLDSSQITTASVPWLSEMPNLKYIFIEDFDPARRSPLKRNLSRALPGIDFY